MAASFRRLAAFTLLALLAVAGGYAWVGRAAAPSLSPVTWESAEASPTNGAQLVADGGNRIAALAELDAERIATGRIVAAGTGTPLGHTTIVANDGGVSVTVDQASGRFVVTAAKVAALRKVDLYFRCPGYEELTLNVTPGLHRPDLGDIALLGAGSLAGMVLGAALPKSWAYEIQATLVCPESGASRSMPRPGQTPLVRESRCGQDNRFFLDGLASGRWKVSISIPQVPPADTLVEVEEGKQAWVDLNGPAAEDVLAGTVVDDRGRPAAGVWLRAEDNSATSGSVTDQHGRFLLCRRHDRRSVTDVRLRGSDPDGSGAIRSGLAQNSTAWGDHDACIVFPQRAAHLVHVRAGDSQEIVEFDLVALFAKVGVGPRKHGPIAGSGGRVTISGAPAGPCLLRVLPAAGSGLSEAEVFCEIPEAGGGETTVVLAPSVRRVGNAAGSDGKPLVARGVRFFEVAEQTSSELQLRGLLGLPASLRQLAEATTNLSGTFETRLPDRVGLQAILDDPNGQASSHLQPVPPHPELIRLTEPIGATVQGRMSGKSFLDFVDSFNSKRSSKSHWSLMFFGAEGQRIAAEIADDGAYRVTDLPPSIWTVVWAGPSSSVELDRFALSAGAAIEKNYDCAAYTPRRIQGVVTLDGSSAEGAELRLASERTREIISIGRASTFESLLVPGSYSVRLVLNPGSTNETWLDRSEKLHVGEVPTSQVSLSFTKRQGVIEILSHDGQPAAGLSVTIDLERFAGQWRTLRTDSNGRLTLSCAPEGDFCLTTTGANPTTIATCRIDRDGQVLRVTAR